MGVVIELYGSVHLVSFTEGSDNMLSLHDLLLFFRSDDVELV